MSKISLANYLAKRENSKERQVKDLQNQMQALNKEIEEINKTSKTIEKCKTIEDCVKKLI
ncbi:MAG: hypothetical protein ACTSO7_03715 [Candidatus Heimdallarchaeota archaeon]